LHMSETTDRVCPECHRPGLTYQDDIDQEGWGSTVEWNCPHCGYYAPSDFALEMDEISEPDDLYNDDDFE
jgi:rubredoxin